MQIDEAYTRFGAGGDSAAVRNDLRSGGGVVSRSSSADVHVRGRDVR